VATPGRGKNGKHTRTLETAERDGEAARLRSLGHGYAEIAVALGYADASGAYRAVMRKLAEVGSEHREAARRLELDRIDRLLLRVQEILDRPGPAVDRMGKPLVDEETGEQLPNREIQLSAIDRASRLLERRAKVMGTDAPRRTVTTITEIPLADLQAAAEVLRQQLGIPAGDVAEASRPMLSATAEAVGQTEAV
jgi:hypothetical protein